MPKTGQRKFVCDDCGEATYFTMRTRHHAARPRWRYCGSLALDPSKQSAVADEIADENERRKQLTSKDRRGRPVGGRFTGPL